MRAERARRVGAGFTLLEVLGAVVVIGVSFTLLARANIQALRAENVARRQLEASLLADRALAEIEAGLLTGSAPGVGNDERQEGGFVVRVAVEPLELGLDPLPERAPAAFGSNDGGPTLLAAPGRAEGSPLRLVRIEVAWPHAGAELAVLRETFVFDQSAVQSILETLVAEERP
jgi:type II secretory pathway pseudopilin PulG